MKWNRDQYLASLTGEGFKRPMFCELLGLLVGLDREWRAQGASEAELDLSAFDFDYVPVARGGCCGFFGGPDTVVMEETEEYRIERDAMGRTLKLCKNSATIPLPLDYPVVDMDSWLKIKPHYAYCEARIPSAELDRMEAEQRDGAVTVVRLPGGYDVARQLMGEENSCLAYYEDPEMMRDILDTVRGTTLRVLEKITARIVVDQISIHEDFAGKSGPLIGPDQIREFIKPYFSPVIDFCRERGTRIIGLDSDGDIRPVIPALLETGVNLLMPMEPAAGMDWVALRKEYGPGLLMKGGIDKHVLRRSKEEIRHELEYKMQPCMRESAGVVFGLDHRIPNGTPLDHYRYYVDTARELLGLPPRGTSHGWAPMLF